MIELKESVIDMDWKNLLGSKKYPEYDKMSSKLHDISNQLTTILSKGLEDKKTDIYMNKVIVEALFKSGAISLGDSYRNEELLSYIYGVKTLDALDSILTLHEALTKKGYTDHYKKKYNSYCDNFFSAYTFEINSDKNVKEVVKLANEVTGRNDEMPKSFIRKVLVVENQSPMFCLIIDYCVFTGDPKTLSFVRLKRNYNSKDRLKELIDKKFKLGMEWSACDDRDMSFGIITSLMIDRQKCHPILETASIDFILLSIGLGLEILNEN